MIINNRLRKQFNLVLCSLFIISVFSRFTCFQTSHLFAGKLIDKIKIKIKKKPNNKNKKNDIEL
jgi:hypothetical protein